MAVGEHATHGPVHLWSLHHATKPLGVITGFRQSVCRGQPEPRTALHPHSIEPWSDQVMRWLWHCCPVLLAPNPKLPDSSKLSGADKMPSTHAHFLLHLLLFTVSTNQKPSKSAQIRNPPTILQQSSNFTRDFAADSASQRAEVAALRHVVCNQREMPVIHLTDPVDMCVDCCF